MPYSVLYFKLYRAPREYLINLIPSIFATQNSASFHQYSATAKLIKANVCYFCFDWVYSDALRWRRLSQIELVCCRKCEYTTEVCLSAFAWAQCTLTVVDWLENYGTDSYGSNVLEYCTAQYITYSYCPAYYLYFLGERARLCTLQSGEMVSSHLLSSAEAIQELWLSVTCEFEIYIFVAQVDLSCDQLWHILS